jgi:hypothetical protein
MADGIAAAGGGSLHVSLNFSGIPGDIAAQINAVPSQREKRPALNFENAVDSSHFVFTPLALVQNTFRFSA